MPTLKTVKGKLEIDGKPVLSGWESYSGWFWFGIEEVEPGYWFGLVQGEEIEWGYFSVDEIMALSPMAWKIKPQDLPISGRRS
jgi:hypothetical protein